MELVAVRGEEEEEEAEVGKLKSFEAARPGDILHMAPAVADAVLLMAGNITTLHSRIMNGCAMPFL